MIKLQSLLVALVAGFAVIHINVLSAAQPDFPEVVSDYLHAAQQSIKTINLDEFRSVVDNPQQEMIVDVRQESEFASGYVPGAINLPRGLLEFKIWQHVGFPDRTDLNKKIYIYCSAGARCSLAAKTLQDLGFTDVTAVLMKLSEWEAAGYPLVKDNLLK